MPKNKALLVGINDYRDFDDLRGCVNDVTNLRLVLKQYRGFTNDEIRVLVDKRATKRAIEERLAWLVRDAAPGDYLLFHFSGHGSAVRDRGPLDELVDGLDEILCPYDMDWEDTFITDDELSARLVVPPGVRIEVVLDCCHAGSDEDESVAPRDAGVGLESRPRFLAPPIDIASRHEGEAVPVRSRLLRAPARAVRPVIWAACGAGQTSADAFIEGVPWGAFTHTLCGLMRRNDGQLARARMLELASTSLSDGGFSQRPELDADDAAGKSLVFAGARS